MFINYPQECGHIMKILFLIIVLSVVYAYVLQKKEANTQKASWMLLEKNMNEGIVSPSRGDHE